MTSTPCASAVLACIIAPWAATIVAVLRAIVEAVLAIVENNRTTLPELGACCRKAGRWLAALSRPLMSKLGFLVPWARSLHALASKRSPEFVQAVLRDLCDTSEARVEAPFAEPSAIEPWRRLMTVLARPELDDDIGSALRTYPHVKLA